MFEVILGLTLLVVILAVIGLAFYGFCVLIARLSGRRARQRGTARRVCGFCGHSISFEEDRCDICGREIRSPLAEELRDLDAVVRQLRRFGDRGALTSAAVNRLLARVKRYREELLAPRRPTPTADARPRPSAQPVATPPEEPIVAEVAQPFPVSPAAQPAAAVPPKPKPQVAEPPAPPKPRTTPKPIPRKPEVPPPAPRPPRMSWGEMLAGFMQQRNIRWIELIAGLLIVGSSVVLVLSLWQTFGRLHYFQLAVSVAATSAVFGVGLYAQRRWRVESTSRSLLLIGTLLTPLNFLLVALSSGGGVETESVAADLVALAIFAWLVGLAGRATVPDGRWHQTVAVLGSSVGVLMVGWWISAESAEPWRLAAGCLPALLFAGSVAAYLAADRKRTRPIPEGQRREGELPNLEKPTAHADEPELLRANATFTLSGTAGFAMLVALGLLVARAGAPMVYLCLPSVLAGATLLACGLTVSRQTPIREGLASHQTAGTAVALVGMAGMLGAIGLAWPSPAAMVGIAGLDAAILVFAAFYFRLPVLHAGAIACGTVAYLAAFHAIDPRSGLPWLAGAEDLGPRMLRLAMGASSGTALGGLFVAMGIVAEWLARRGHRAHGAVYAGGCGVVAVVGLMLVTIHGVKTPPDADAVRAMILYAVYGAGSLALAARWNRAALSYLGLSLLAAATMWLLWWQTGEVRPVWAAALAGCGLLMGGVGAALGRRVGPPPGDWRDQVAALRSAQPVEVFRLPLLHVAEVVGALALGLGVVSGVISRETPMLPLAAAGLAALAWLLAWTYRSPGRTWAGSMLLLAGLVHTLAINYPAALRPDRPWVLVALLAHASLTLAAAVTLDLRLRERDERLRDSVDRVLARPLSDTALLSSTIAVLVLIIETTAGHMSPGLWAAALFWLAAVWLVAAWHRHHAGIFAAHQAALSMAVVAATAAWLETSARWIARVPADLVLRPRSLQAYAVALGLLSLAWVLVRIGLRRRAHNTKEETWAVFLSDENGESGRLARAPLLVPEGFAVDRLVRHGVAWGQFLLVGWCVLPGLARELWPRAALPGATLAATGREAWAVLAVMAAAMIAALWYRWRVSSLSSLLLVATVPWLIAGGFAVAAHDATASALRWGAAAGFLVGSAGVWRRDRLWQMATALGAKIDTPRWGPRAARAVLLVTMAAPVVVLTVAAAVLQLGGVTMPGPAPGSFFDRLGPSVSYLVPLAMVVMGLVGHALHERSAGYAFAAGLVTKLAVGLGHALHVVTTGDGEFGVTETVVLTQLLTITAGIWALSWLAVQQRWHPAPADAGTVGRARSALMSLQLAMGLAGNVLLLTVAFTSLALLPADAHAWTEAAGRLPGWLALGSAMAALGYRRMQAGRGVSPQWTGLAGMAVMGLVACTIRGLLPLWGQGPEWGYRALMLGWAGYSLLIVLVTWWVASIQTLPGAQGPPQAVIRAAAVWVRVAGLAAVVLGLKAAIWDADEQLWAAAAIATASAAGATMAVWRRREGWAFAAALGVNLAASLVVWHYQRALDFQQWWLRLVQANVIASAVVALGWLAARRRLYQLRELNLGTSPLLATQVNIAAVGNGAVLLLAVVGLVVSPGGFSGATMRLVAQLSDGVGWTALLLAAVAVGWYFRHALPDKLVHVLGGLTLGAGVLVACGTGTLADRIAWLGRDEWLMYHALVVAWTVAGCMVLAAGLLGRNVRLAAEGSGEDAAADFPRKPIFGRHAILTWVTAIGALVVFLAVVHVTDDPAKPWLSAGALLATSVMAGVLAVWLRRQGYVAMSGLLLNLIGVAAWLARDRAAWDLPGVVWLVQANVVALGIAAAVWSAVAWMTPERVGDFEARTSWPAYRDVAARLAVGLLAGVVVVEAAACGFAWRPSPVVGPLDWIALTAAGLGTVPRFWGRHGRMAAAGLGVLGLSAVGLGLCSRGLSGRAFCHAATIEWAGAIAVLAALGAVAARGERLWRALRVQPQDDSPRVAWLPAAWAVLVGLLAVASAWISADFAFDSAAYRAFDFLHGRAVGPVAGASLLATAVLLAGSAQRRWRRWWQQGAMWLGLVLLAEMGFVWLVPEGDPPWVWLHRSVLMLAAAVVMALVAGFGLRRVLPPDGEWVASARRLTPWFGGLALGLLAAVLVQEAIGFNVQTGAPMAWPAIVVVGVALGALMAGCLALAVEPRWDPLGLDERQRQVYVYLAEALACLIGLHLWFSMPWLFTRGLVRRFWMLIALGVAFVGAGLAEWFRRRAMPVLAKPLERTALLIPAIPAVGYWFIEGTSAKTWFIGHASPVVWLLMALFYGMMAVRYRSAWLGVLGILTANTGLWTLWDRLDVAITEHPQLWLIPLALAGLAAEHLNRDRLSKAQVVAVRYLSLSVIYVSSTADMFIAGIGTDLVTPLVLMLLAVGGALAGILLRVRSFLYLGVAFLVLDIGTMVWYASFQRHLWWVAALCGLALGIAVFVFVGVVEKRRNEFLGAMKRLGEWEE